VSGTTKRHHKINDTYRKHGERRKPTMNKKVIVYTTKDCIECTMVKQVLAQEGITFESRDISSNSEYQKEVETFGFLGVPVTVVENRAVKGFTNELKELIELAKQEE
jgi:glutaredoxin-like protein NrdH